MTGCALIITFQTTLLVIMVALNASYVHEEVNSKKYVSHEKKYCSKKTAMTFNEPNITQQA